MTALPSQDGIIKSRHGLFRSFGASSFKTLSARVTAETGMSVVIREGRVSIREAQVGSRPDAASSEVIFADLEIYSGENYAIGLCFPFPRSEIGHCAVQVRGQQHVVNQANECARQIEAVEGFASVTVERWPHGKEAWSDMLELDLTYPYARAAKSNWTLTQWRKLRFAKAFGHGTVDVCDRDGRTVHGATLLRNIRR